MTSRKEPDHFDWFGALKAASEQARETRGPRPLRLVVTCRCGATEDRVRDLGEVVDLRDADVSVMRNEGGRPCRACPHYIHHGAMCVVRYFGDTTTVRDHYHPECVRLT
jgi:hypothetical protein